ncbi:MAG TPA: sugar transferase [Terriglobales bacterium]|jgi:exopolysaccharide biosynthesis polyprenyl glycosylphosphotransferase|nr:sugar transferase [Terriglobales bacterium]
MSLLRRQLLLSAFKLADLVLLVCSFLLATLPVLHQKGVHSTGEFFSMRVKIDNLLVFGGLMFAWHVICVSLHLYDSKRLSNRKEEINDVLKATTVATVVVSFAAVLFTIRMVTPLFLVSFWTISSAATIASRLFMRKLLAGIRRRGRNLRNMLIIGTNPRALAFARRVEARPELGYRVLGFADQQWNGLSQFRRSGYPLVCDLERLPSFLRQTVVDEVVITLPLRSFHLLASRVASLCEQQGIIMRLMSNLFDLKRSWSKTEEFEGDSLITHYTVVDGWPAVVKRLLDVVGSFVLLVLFSPVMLAVAALIRLTSPGLIFFAQERLGLNKRRFRMYKFRTMVPDAEQRLKEVEHLNEQAGPVFKIKDDPRITPLGRWLRRTSIDELPQLLNVLKGDMSLVGPRPLPVRDYELFNHQDCPDWQRRRFSVRPGITCLWQIEGRNSVPFEQWMELDLQYIQRWSLWLDMQILARTIPAVFRGSGAS